METAHPLPRELLELVAQAITRLSKPQRTRLAVDLSGAWWGLRTAVLVDSITLSKVEVEALNRGMQGDHLPLFFAHEATTEQSLLVNRDLLVELSERKEPNSINVAGDTPLLSYEQPRYEKAVFASLLSHDVSSPSPLILPPPYHSHDLIGAVGRLLDYPFPYCLDGSQDGRNCLGGVELVVVDAFLKSALGRQRLLSFSYPSSFADDPSTPSLAISHVAKTLQHTLQARLQASIRSLCLELERCEVKVENRRTTMARVAL